MKLKSIKSNALVAYSLIFVGLVILWYIDRSGYFDELEGTESTEIELRVITHSGENVANTSFKVEPVNKWFGFLDSSEVILSEDDWICFRVNHSGSFNIIISAPNFQTETLKCNSESTARKEITLQGLAIE